MMPEWTETQVLPEVTHIEKQESQSDSRIDFAVCTTKLNVSRRSIAVVALVLGSHEEVLLSG
jgi:hypothetical protein